MRENDKGGVKPTRTGQQETHPASSRIPAAGLDSQGIARTGAHTGRSAQDTVVVRNAATESPRDLLRPGGI